MVAIPLKAGHRFRLIEDGTPVLLWGESRNPLKSGAPIQTLGAKGLGQRRIRKVAIPLKAGHRFRLYGMRGTKSPMHTKSQSP